MTFSVLPCNPDAWLGYLARGYRLACERHPLMVADLVPWNGGAGGWLVVLLMGEGES